MKQLYFSLFIVLLVSCDKTASEESVEQNAGTGAGTETLAISTNSYVTLDIKALNSVDAVAVQGAASSFSGSVGSLAIDAGTTLTATNKAPEFTLTEPLPKDNPNQITSGPPEVMQLTIYKIEFASNDSEVFPDLLSLKSGHLTQWAKEGLSQEVIDDLQANVVGKEYNGKDELVAALQASGMQDSDFKGLTIIGSTFDTAYVFSDGDTAAEGSPVVFDDEDGVTITVNSGTVDLSELLAKAKAASGTASAEGEAKFPIKTGSYSQLSVTFKHSALVKGCLSAEFATSSAQAGAHKYCTRSGKSLYDVGSLTNSDFEDQEAQLMKIPLGRSFDKGSTSEAAEFKDRGYMPIEYADKKIDLKFELPAGFKVENDSNVELSMVLDLNRMLRYYNQGDHTSSATSHEGANPSYPTVRPHFFTTIFEQSVYVFAGKPGRAYGYEMVAYGCDGVNQTAGCDGTLVSFWTTIITDKDGKPIVVSSMPDDDRDFTVISNNWGDIFHDLSSNSQNRDCTKIKTHVPAQNPGVADLIRKNTADSAKVDYLYGIGCDFYGYMLGFDPSLEAYSIGDNLPLFHFQLEHSQNRVDSNSSSDISGPVYGIRRL